MPQKKNNQSVILMGFSIVMLFIVFYFLVLSTKKTIQQKTFDQLLTIRDFEVQQLETKLTNLRKQIQTLAESSMVKDALQNFSDGFTKFAVENSQDNTKIAQQEVQKFYQKQFVPALEKYGFNISQESILRNISALSNSGILLQKRYVVSNTEEKISSWGKAHSKYHQSFSNYAQIWNYADILLIDTAQQQIVYSVAKQIDFASTVTSGFLSESALAYAYESAISNSQASITDFQYYVPCKEKAVSFISYPIEINGEKVGVIAVKIYADNFFSSKKSQRNITTYLLGEDNLVRSNSSLLKEDSDAFVAYVNHLGITADLDKILSRGTTILLQKVHYHFEKDTSCGVKQNTNGDKTIVAQCTIKDTDLPWRIVVEKNVDESFFSVQNLQDIIMLCCVVLLFIVIILAISAANNKKKEAIQTFSDSVTQEIGSIHRQIKETQKFMAKILKKAQENNVVIADLYQKISAFGEDVSADEKHTQHIESVCDEVYENLQKNAQQIDVYYNTSQDINRAIKQVQSMIDLMENIAKETHIVSLNASVRAAREGNTSFSSVADEVRKLSVKSAEVLEKTSEQVNAAQKVAEKSGAIIENKSSDIQSQAQKMNTSLMESIDSKKQLTAYIEDIIKELSKTELSCANLQKDLESITLESSHLANQVENTMQKLKKT